jgi:hypothetical protein
MKKQTFPPSTPGKYFVLNRLGCVVKPTERFLEWVSGIEGCEVEAVELVGPTIFLFDEGNMLEEEAFARGLRRHWPMIAAEQFSGWTTNLDDWPEIRGFPEFFEYFECTRADMVHDLENKRLEREEF